MLEKCDHPLKGTYLQLFGESLCFLAEAFEFGKFGHDEGASRRCLLGTDWNEMKK